MAKPPKLCLSTNINHYGITKALEITNAPALSPTWL